MPSGWTIRQVVAVAVLASMYGVSSQFVDNGAFFGTPQSAPLVTRSQVLTTNSTTDASASGSVQGSKFSSNDDSGSVDSSNGGSGSSSDGSESSASGDGSGSGSWIMGSGTGSSSLEYGCDCRSVRRVSLMGASDYCLAPEAPLSSKCGNVDLGESGACPTTGAHPCSPKGHVLANDSLCALDDKDETYKCVASKNDLEIQKHGKKKKKKSSRRHGSGSSSMSAAPEMMPTARQVLAIVVCVAAGVMAVV